MPVAGTPIEECEDTQPSAQLFPYEEEDFYEAPTLPGAALTVVVVPAQKLLKAGRSLSPRKKES